MLINAVFFRQVLGSPRSPHLAPNVRDDRETGTGASVLWSPGSIAWLGDTLALFPVGEFERLCLA
jgi:hypothetical protein